VSISGPGASRLKKKRDSQASYTSDTNETESNFRELEMNMDIIDEYYYGVRIFPGQDPSQVKLLRIFIDRTLIRYNLNTRRRLLI